MNVKNMTRQQLESIIERLTTDSLFGCYTRQALEFFYPDNYGLFSSLVFFDIDYMHDLNAKFGYDEVNRRINESLSTIRKSDVKIYRWFSGDEIVIFLTTGNPVQFAERIIKEFSNRGIGVTCAINEDLTECLNDTVNIAVNKVQNAKSENIRGIILE